ncbi:O-antigen ligase family protein [Magnetospirillum sulfuroxidans]|uniref:O-antigen ligase family protein n=1 Tax=Magnetospirillum sulfuroxidans TaxID=611300 RepID=A0ABS5IED6_9PROT|nr:O-antigen ligase family protein [Magnetospirillum sulfuroxidans]MBR9972786.1 O-antigen ligase family protein [Magnetospirillum sulfuroxidans]
MTKAISTTGLTAPALFMVGLLGPLLALFAPLGMAPLFILIALAGLHDCWRFRLWARLDRSLLAILAATVLFGAISTLWAIDKTQTLKTSLVLGGEFLSGLCLLAATSMLLPQWRIRLLYALAAGLSLSITVLLLEHLTPGFSAQAGSDTITAELHDSRLSSLSRGITLMALLLVPTALPLWRQGLRLWAVLLWLGGAVAIATSHSLASKLVLPVSTILVLLFWRYPRLTASLCAIGTAAIILVAFPLALQIPPSQQAYDDAPWLSSSSHHRLTIWRFSAHKTLEKPFFGWALDASRVIPGADDEVFYDIIVNGNQRASISEAQLPLHPHSAPIQIWLELGLLGAILAAAFMGRVFWTLGRQPGRVAAHTGPAVVSGFIIACVSYGIWQSWWQGTLWLSVALIAVLNLVSAKARASSL